MTMKENPYSKFLDMLKPDSNPASGVMIGRVMSASPLVITCNDLQIYEDDVLIADDLLIGYKRIYSTDHSDPIWSDRTTMKYEDGLEVNDLLAMLPTSDKQLYIILARVRRL